MRSFAGAVITAVILATAPHAWGEFRNADVIVGGLVFQAAPPPSDIAKIRQFAVDGTFIREVPWVDDPKGIGDLKFGNQNVLHIAAFGTVQRLTSDGALLPALDANGYGIEALALTNAGDIYGSGIHGHVLHFAPDGSQSVDAVSANGIQWSDLAPDQCTLFYVNLGRIGRFDVCRRVALTSLPTILPTNQGFALLMLRDGSFIVSAEAMYRIASDGTILRKYNTAGVAYARDSTPRFVWIAHPNATNTRFNRFAKFDTTTDTIVTGPFESGLDHVSSIAVVGADAETTPIPTMSATILVALISALAVAGWIAARRG
jgi:hypothetical protein